MCYMCDIYILCYIFIILASYIYIKICIFIIYILYIYIIFRIFYICMDIYKYISIYTQTYT